MKNLYSTLTIVLLTLSIVVSVSAQKFTPAENVEPAGTPVAKTPPTTDKKEKKKDKEKVEDRVKQLEAQVLAMQEQLEALKKALVQQKSAATPKAPADQALASVTPTGAKEPVTAAKAPVRKEKGDLSFDAGDYRVTPYGIVFANLFANSDGTNNADDPMWAIPGRLGNTSASARQTRLGIRFEGGKLGGANIKGVVEADFYGGMPSVGVGENMGVLRLRLANIRLDWERTSLLVGQDWVLFAPNNPTSLVANAIPQFAAAGNPWSRLPQVRIEQKIGKKFKWQGAVLAPGTGDFPTSGTPVLLQPGSGAASRVPFFQSRFSFTEGNWFGTKKAGTIGVAGHYGRSRVSNGYVTEHINSAGLAVDWKFPIVKRVTASGEAFFGENLGGFQAGIFQGYNSDFGTPESFGSTAASVRAIATRGGWLQLGWNIPALEDRLSIYGSFGIDDPRNKDLISVGQRNFRDRNIGYAFDAIYKFSPQFSIGGEFRRLETSYILGSQADSNHFNLGAKYSF